MRLGDLAVVEIAVSNTGSGQVENIALVDRIPAGWEIENPRLGRDGAVGWVDEEALWEVDHLNLRDDRLEAFGGLKPGETRRVVYTVRAVTAGHFKAPPVSAEAMYDPRIWARELGGSVVIKGPWDEDASGTEAEGP